MICFGPIPSRRLGKSLGINNIPVSKICSYSCIYCQIGLTEKKTIFRTECYKPEKIYDNVMAHIEKIKEEDIPDYITFVTNGEPTLDINLGNSILLLKKTGIPVAVITNASLLYLQQVQDELLNADWVSVKVDAGSEEVWHLINQPAKSLHFETYLQSLLQFSKKYKGSLHTETMIVKNVNDNTKSLTDIADIISQIQPDKAYISIPTRPPAAPSVNIPDESVLNSAYQIFTGKDIETELLIGFEGTNTGYTGDIAEDILNICAVHPIREDTMQELIFKNKADATIIRQLIAKKKIKEVFWNNKKFYIKEFIKNAL